MSAVLMEVCNCQSKAGVHSCF